MTRILFVTWDGPQVNYLETLFLPIFAALKEHGIRTDVLQFRWGDPTLAEAVARACGDAGIGYRPVHILRRPMPFGPFVSAAFGGRHVRAAIRAFGSDLLMPRGMMPAMTVLAAGSNRLLPTIFDADGLPADERVELGQWSRTGAVYNIMRAVEKGMVRRAEITLVRSRAGGEILAERARVDQSRFKVVVNGRDDRVFSPGTGQERQDTRAELGLTADAPLLVFAGSAGPQYRFDLIAKTAASLRGHSANARLLILTGSPDEAAARLHSFDHSLDAMTDVRRVAPEQVGRYLAAADAGLSFRMRSLATRAVAPVKLGEYLLCGVPVIGTSGIGDTAPAQRAGVFLDEAAGADAGADWLMNSVLSDREGFRRRARNVGLECFSLDRSVQTYLQAFAGHVPEAELSGSGDRAPANFQAAEC